YHPQNSHVIPGLLRKFHEAKVSCAREVVVWGTGTVRREFLFSDDMSEACVFLMNLADDKFDALLGSDESVTGRFEPPLVNVGVGHDLTIGELALLVKDVTGFDGEIVFDTSQPDGTPRKLLDVGLLERAGWKAMTPLTDGLRIAYRDFLAAEAARKAQ
ncbi:MAG: NAD-dependent epimerase/dehydratase family protein, partial [Rhizobacter sp.]|nr:NAD-dependent epimerase/dehydratase family protein [Rhizobacter sp.]